PYPREDYYKAMFRAMARFVPSHNNVRALCIVCEDHRKDFEFSPFPWEPLSGDFRYNYVPGNHYTCITTFARSVAEVLDCAFELGNEKTLTDEGPKRSATSAGAAA